MRRQAVTCDEGAVRELFTTVLGDEAGYVILDTIKAGDVIVIKMEDGSTAELTTQQEALRVMAGVFSWWPSQPVAKILPFQIPAPPADNQVSADAHSPMMDS